MKPAQRPQILVVEDEAIVAHDLGHRLESMGYFVPCITMSGEEALEKAGEMHPDLVLMDINLKGDMDGVTAASQIRDRHHLPIIYLTAYSDADTLERAKVTEPSAYILKPFVERELHTAIELALYKHSRGHGIPGERLEARAALRALHQAVMVTDLAGLVTFMNPVAEQLVGRAQAETVGHPITDFFRLISWPAREPLGNPVDRVLRYEAAFRLGDDTMLRTLDGRDIPIELEASPVADERGGLRGVVLLIREVTDARRNEQALRTREARLAAVLEAAPEAILSLDHEGRITDLNPTAEKMLGWRRPELLGRALAEQVIAHGWRDWVCFEMASLAANPDQVPRGQLVELNALQADGRELPVEFALRRHGLEGPPVFTAYLRDLSRHRNFEEELNKLVIRLQNARDNSQERQLGGLLPICSYCKKIRNVSGGWEQLEAYFAKRSHVAFSHTYCPDCMLQARRSFGLPI